MSAVAVGPPRLVRDRDKAKKRLLRSPRSMGGLARGRVRPDCKEGSRKRNRAAVTTEGPALRVIRYHGKSCINWAWENLGILIRKMLTAKNL